MFEIPTHIIAYMIGQVLRMCKDYIAMHVQCFPHAICQDTIIIASINCREFFFSISAYIMGGMNGLWAISPGLSGDLN